MSIIAGTPQQNSNGETFDSVAVAPAGGYWVGGALWAAPSDPASTTPEILKVQANGSITFSKTFTKFSGGKYHAAVRLIADADGATVFGRSYTGPYGDMDAWVARVDNNNKLIYEYFFGGPGEDSFRDAVAAADGSYLVAGSFNVAGAQSGMSARFSPLGSLIWQRILDQSSSAWNGIALNSAGGVVLAGTTSCATGCKSLGGNDFITATCDQFGNCDCASSGTCLTKTPADIDDKNPCTLDSCEAGQPKYAIGNEGLTCATGKTCQKGKCL